MEQATQPTDTAAVAAAAPFLLPRSTPSPPPATATATTATTTAKSSSSSSSRPASPSPPPAGPSLLAPGRVRTNSGTTCSAQGTADYCDDDDDDDDAQELTDDEEVGDVDQLILETPAKAIAAGNSAAAEDEDGDCGCCAATHASPTCIADVSLIDDALDGEVEVSLVEVEVEDESSASDDADDDLEGSEYDDADGASLASHDGSSSYRLLLHHPGGAVLDAPATPRAAQLILEDMSTTPVYTTTPGSNNESNDHNDSNGDHSGSNLLSSLLFCGATDAMLQCQKDQDLTSSPMIRPVSLTNVNANANANSSSGSGSGTGGKSPATPLPTGLPDLQQPQPQHKGGNITGTACAATRGYMYTHEARPSSSGQAQRDAASRQEEEAAAASSSSPSPMASKLSCAPSCKAASKATAGADQKLHEQTAVEATIGNFLSSPGEWCDGWQAWSLHMAAVCDGSSSSSSINGNIAARDHTELKTVLRNRAGDLNARRKRIHRLRRDLSPFDTVNDGSAPAGAGSGPAGAGTGAGAGAGGRHLRSVSAANTTNNSPAGSTAGGPPSAAAAVLSGRDGMATPPPVPGRTVKKSRSFADAAIVLTRSTTNNNSAADDASSVVSITSSIVDAISNCDVDSVSGSGVGRGRKGGKRGNGSGKASGHRRTSDAVRASNGTLGSDADGDREEDLCYDSDPEQSNGNCRDLRRQSLHLPKPRLPPTAGGTSEENTTTESVGRFLSQGGTWSAGEPNQEPEPTPAVTSTIDPTNDDHIAKAVDGILHRRMMLVWHQPDGPVAVYAWIELGSQLRSALIQPKLMWKPVHDTEDERGALGITNHINLHSVDLLDISRILASAKVDRKRHPLAKSKCSLSIETFDHNLLFETSCQQERDALVQGLKGLVARLASKIIVGDERVFDEYFTPFGAVVPGEAPEWART